MQRGKEQAQLDHAKNGLLKRGSVDTPDQRLQLRNPIGPIEPTEPSIYESLDANFPVKTRVEQIVGSSAERYKRS